MGIFGESKQEIINRFEKALQEKNLQIENLKKSNFDKERQMAELKKNIEDLNDLSQQRLQKDLSNDKTPNNNIDSNIIICAGKYRGGTNIPIGIYNLKILSGTGIIATNHPDKIFVRLESNSEEREKHNWSDKYNGLVITDETILDIGESAEVKFTFSAKLNYDEELEKYKQRKKEIIKEIELLEKTRDDEKAKVGDLFVLGNGTYYGGKTIPAGIYNLKILVGSCMVETKKPNKWFNLGVDCFEQEYVGLEIRNETVLKINNQAKIQFHLTIKPESQDEMEEKHQLMIANYEKKKQELELKIDGLKAEMEELNSLPNEVIGNENDKIILGAGRYKGGIDIAVGSYNLKLLSGIGNFEINKPDDIYLRMTKNKKDQNDYGWIEEYKNLEVSNKSVIKVSESARIGMVRIGQYSYSKEKEEIEADYEQKKRELEIEYAEKYSGYCEQYNKIKSEIEIVRAELKILNNEAVKKYYIFSDYDGITSQDCKNNLFLLKSEEKDLRNAGSDIDVLTMKVEHKITERGIRQILRNFSSECENIMKNISTKNIDIVRNKIQKSYDSLNKLYGFDGVRLSKKILELKLKQATLLYTYELKYQQEKDIQQAIKEQMLEEAKAEREIQEQKKKIEKDLQQHLGEVNRLMKYLQKTKIDVERQLYMDKIKELEEKIKLLQSDKETILEREANAKAGFVYIISNIGSFGEDIYKIGMTRRLEPMDRVRELSSASVPFEFDVHAMIFSSDAPDLETMLHHHFADRAVNKVNPRKEFYRVSIDEIEQVVKENYNDTVQFTKIPVAFEYRQSLDLD